MEGLNITPRTPTLPPTEPTMWRKLLAAAHPDRNGDHDLFIWTMNVREVVCDEPELGKNRAVSDSPRQEPWREPPRGHDQQEPDCVPFDPDSDFDELTRDALILADELPEPYTTVLLCLKDCTFSNSGMQYDQQQRGASYKQLAAIGHRAGMDKSQRVRWYRIAESIPLSRRHAGHIFGRLD